MRTESERPVMYVYLPFWVCGVRRTLPSPSDKRLLPKLTMTFVVWSDDNNTVKARCFSLTMHAVDRRDDNVTMIAIRRIGRPLCSWLQLYFVGVKR